MQPNFGFEISGGINAIPHEFPWTVFLLGGCANTECGGALVSPRIIVSARHCAVRPFDKLPCDHSDGQTRAYLGLHSYNASQKESYYSIPIAAVKTPSFIPKKGDKEFDDFVIFILKYPAVYSKVVRPICLPQQYEESYNKKATVVGWGMFRTGSTKSPFLNKVELKISPPVDQVL